MRYRETPVRAGAARRRFDGVLAGVDPGRRDAAVRDPVGPAAGGWLWVGSQVNHNTGSVSVGILVAFAGMLTTILITLAIAMRLDRAWSWCAGPPATSRRTACSSASS